MTLTLVVMVIVVTLAFTYTNGFHDTANAIATVVGTKVLTPRQAIQMMRSAIVHFRAPELKA